VGCVHVTIDGCVSLPLIHEPVADPELESQFPHLGVVRIKMLVMQHAGRNVNRVALNPFVSLAVNL